VRREQLWREWVSAVRDLYECERDGRSECLHLHLQIDSHAAVIAAAFPETTNRDRSPTT